MTLSFEKRQEIRQALNERERARVAAHKEAQRNACACKVCLGRQEGTHGESLYTKQGCRCVVCRNARASSEQARKRNRRRREQRAAA